MSRVFSIVPASPAPFVVIGIVVLTLLAGAAFFSFTAYKIRFAKFEINGSGLRIHSGIYGRSVSKTALNPGAAKILNLKQDREFVPKWRTNGVGLPGYQEGWFKLKNGEKALVFVTDPTRVLYLPTKEGYSLLLSADQPDAFLKALQD